MLGSVFLQHRAVAVVLDSGRPTRQPARVLSLAPGRFRRPAALALAREGRSRSSLLWLLLFGLLCLPVAALFAFGHSFLRCRSGPGSDALSVRRRTIEQMIEVGHDAVDQLTPAGIRRRWTLGEEAQKIAGLLDRLRPTR